MRPLGRSSPLLVAALALLFIGAAAMAETETQTQTTESGSTQQYVHFSLVPSPVSGAQNYPEGNGSADLQVEGTLVAVHIQAQGMAHGAQFMLILTSNGTSHSIANMTTGDDGELEAEAAIPLAPGSYSIGLQVFDRSSFASPTLVLASSPATRQVALSQTQTSNSQTTETQPVTTFQGGESEDDGIRTAIQSKVIPAVVDVGEGGASVTVNDHNFSVSVGSFQQDGYLISISANNITGPRVLLVNLTQSAARTLFSGNLLITMDGAQVQQASTFSQVLGVQPGDPARFAVLSSTSGYKLLISIPHFSYHAIEILPILAQAGRALLVDLPVLLASMAAISLVVVFAYARRTRYAA